ncbi:MAG: hypothetical protein AB8B55_11855 [Mariniblastus sp.]
MSQLLNSQQILDREYLEVRAKILEIAAALDRIDRGEGDVANDPRMTLLADGIKVIAADQSDPIRAEKIQLLFSREYDAKWQKEFAIATRT